MKPFYFIRKEKQVAAENCAVIFLLVITDYSYTMGQNCTA
jgi:hypothetical protein